MTTSLSMNRRDFLNRFSLGLGSAAFFPRLGKSEGKPFQGLENGQGRRPNVVFFLVDDMGWMDCGAYGSQYYETPNMDRFAKRAMRFTDAYAQPLCSPTRCSLLTGQYSARHGITSATGHRPPQAAGFKYLPETAPANQALLVPESKNFMEPSEYTLAEALHDAGYRTAHLGKWHLGLTRPYWPEQQGFDVTFHCHPDPGPPGGYFSPYGVQPDGEPRGKTRVGNITDGPPGEYIVDRLADEAIKFIEASKERPFFLNLWNYGVHGPWGHKPEYTKIFATKKDPRGVQGNPIMGSMLRSVDECFGRILATLDRLGLTDNTIVIFNSDNGGNTHSNTAEDGKIGKNEDKESLVLDWRKWAGFKPPTNNLPLRDGKGTLYEGGTRVPLMWVWPGHIQPGVTNDTVVGHIDLYPTLLDMIGIPPPAQQKIDGVSYAAVLRQTGKLNRSAFFNYFPHGRSPGRAGGVWVRRGDWKLFRWFGLAAHDPELYELYNLRDDLGETKNLATAQPALVKELDALIEAFLIDTGATYPRPNPAYKPVLPDSLHGWKARQCNAEVKNGALVLTLTGQPSMAFLGHVMGNTHGPVTVKCRVRTSVGGAGKVECLSKMFSFEVPAGDWQEVSVTVPISGAIGTTRIYLPIAAQPLELEWIEISGSNTKTQRWDFGKKVK